MINPKSQRLMLSVSVTIVLCLFGPHAFAQGKVKKNIKQGNLLYNKGDFEEALKEYEKAFLSSPDSDIVNFNLGTAIYKTKDYKAAINHFEKSLVTNDRSLEEKASYNVANAEYKYGIGKEKEDLDGAIKLLESSLKHYERAIAIDQKDGDAKFNYEFVKKELERLKKTKDERRKTKDEEKKEDKGKEGEKGEKGEEKKETKDEGRRTRDEQEKQEEKQGGEETKDEGRRTRDEQEKQEEKQEGEETKDEGRGTRDEQKEKEEAESREEERKQEEERKRQEEEREKEVDTKDEGRRTKDETRRTRDETSQGGAGSADRTQEMSEREALMLLESYKGDEEPRSLYKEKMPVHELPEPVKDW